MKLFRSFQLAASAPVARERLQILFEYERKLGSQIDLFTVLREEILAVVSRHVNVDPDMVEITVDRGSKFSKLAVDIEIPNPGGEARMVPTDCPVLHRDKTVGASGFNANRAQMVRGEDGAAGTLAVPTWLAGSTLGAILLAAKKAGSVGLITSLFRVGLIAAVVLGAYLYVQQSDVSKRRALDDRKTALMPGFEEQVNAARAAKDEVAAGGPSVVLPGTSGPGTVVSLRRDPATPDSAAQFAAVTLVASRGSVTSPPRELPPLRDTAAGEPVSQSVAVAPLASPGSVTQPAREPPQLHDRAAVDPVLESAAVTPPAKLEGEAPLREPPPAAVDPVLESVAVTPPAKLEGETPPREPPPAAVGPVSESALVTPPDVPGTASPPHEPPQLRDPTAVDPVLQSAAVTPPTMLESDTSRREPLPLRHPAAVDPVLQSATITPPAMPGSVTSPPQEPARGNIARAAVRKCHAIAAPPAASGPHWDAAACGGLRRREALLKRTAPKVAAHAQFPEGRHRPPGAAATPAGLQIVILPAIQPPTPLIEATPIEDEATRAARVGETWNRASIFPYQSKQRFLGR
jgi:cell division topological specificity factor